MNRATADRDLLATDPQALEPALWAGLVLLKLFAGGPQDAWDIAQLLNGDDRDLIVGEVRLRLGDLPPDCRRLRERLLLA